MPHKLEGIHDFPKFHSVTKHTNADLHVGRQRGTQCNGASPGTDANDVVSTSGRTEPGEPASRDVWTSGQAHVGKEDHMPASFDQGRPHNAELEDCPQSPVQGTRFRQRVAAQWQMWNEGEGLNKKEKEGQVTGF